MSNLRNLVSNHLSLWSQIPNSYCFGLDFGPTTTQFNRLTNPIHRHRKAYERSHVRPTTQEQRPELIWSLHRSLTHDSRICRRISQKQLWRACLFKCGSTSRPGTVTFYMLFSHFSLELTYRLERHRRYLFCGFLFHRQRTIFVLPELFYYHTKFSSAQMSRSCHPSSISEQISHSPLFTFFTVLSIRELPNLNHIIQLFECPLVILWRIFMSVPLYYIFFFLFVRPFGIFYKYKKKIDSKINLIYALLWSILNYLSI